MSMLFYRRRRQEQAAAAAAAARLSTEPDAIKVEAAAPEALKADVESPPPRPRRNGH